MTVLNVDTAILFATVYACLSASHEPDDLAIANKRLEEWGISLAEAVTELSRREASKQVEASEDDSLKDLLIKIVESGQPCVSADGHVRCIAMAKTALGKLPSD